LGAVTMVCFIDDDIVSEGFSVTEEVFLLKNTENKFADRNADVSVNVVE
jgi:hypothetical protein